MKTYRISEASLTAPEGVVIVMEFPTMGRHTVLLNEAAGYIKSTQGLCGRMPTRVSLEDGRKVGAFPTITARTELAAEALSTLVGYPIVPGDGVRCATQLQAREIATTLHRGYGVPMKNLECQWMVTPPEPVVSNKRPLATEAQVAAQFEDSPF